MLDILSPVLTDTSWHVKLWVWVCVFVYSLWWLITQNYWLRACLSSEFIYKARCYRKITLFTYSVSHKKCMLSSGGNVFEKFYDIFWLSLALYIHINITNTYPLQFIINLFSDTPYKNIYMHGFFYT